VIPETTNPFAAQRAKLGDFVDKFLGQPFSLKNVAFLNGAPRFKSGVVLVLFFGLLLLFLLFLVGVENGDWKFGEREGRLGGDDLLGECKAV